MVSPREVVITGLGVVSPIGTGRDAFASALRAGKSGVRPIARFDASALPVRIGAELADFEPKLYVKPRKSLKVMSREIQTGVAAANLAVEDAALEGGQVDPDRFGVLFGSEMMYADLCELVDLYRSCLVHGKFHFERFGPNFPNEIFPLWMLKYLPNMTASHIGILHGARGPNNTIVLGEVSSLLAVIEAAAVIERGQADVMIAGGAGSRLSVTPLMYRGDIDCSHRNDAPAAASRPFELHRDGMVNGEGAGAFVLESREHAERRGAGINARILGYGRGHSGSLKGLSGRQRTIEHSIQSALKHGKLQAQDLGHVNAHGLSTRDNDRAEAMAIHALLDDVPVTAVKSYFGNLGAGGGAVELAASIVGLPIGEVPMTLNYEQPDEECPICVVHSTPLHVASKTFLALNQSGTGQAAAVVLDAA